MILWYPPKSWRRLASKLNSSVFVMAPSDGTLTGRAESTSFARLTPTSDPDSSERRINRLSLNRKRPRNAAIHIDGQQPPTPASSDHVNVISASKKIREDYGDDVMNGHNHHKILESAGGRFSGSGSNLSLIHI